LEKEKVITIINYLYYYLPLIASVSLLFIMSKVHRPDTLLVLCDTPISGSGPQDGCDPAIGRDTIYQNLLTDLMIINGIRARSDNITEEGFQSLGVLPSWMLLKYADRLNPGTRLKLADFSDTHILMPCLCYGRRYATVALRLLSGD
jgi:hypothetical protein